MFIRLKSLLNTDEDMKLGNKAIKNILAIPSLNPSLRGYSLKYSNVDMYIFNWSPAVRNKGKICVK